MRVTIEIQYFVEAAGINVTDVKVDGVEITPVNDPGGQTWQIARFTNTHVDTILAVAALDQ